MFEKFLSANSNDFRQRYEGTYGFYKDENGKRLLTRLDSVNEDMCRFVDARGVEYNLRADASGEKGFEFLPPRSAWYNTAIGAILIQRVAQRHFSRGVSGRNISANLMGEKGFLAQTINFPLLERVYEKTLTPKEAKSLFEKGSIPSFAINNLICFSNLGPIILLGQQIGMYERNDSAYKVTLDDKSLFRTEIADAFKELSSEVTFA